MTDRMRPEQWPEDCNESTADVLIQRLNDLIEDEPLVAVVIGRMNQCRVFVEDPYDILLKHPTIQVFSREEDPVIPRGSVAVSFMGLLNGFCGAIPSGKREGWGYISGVREDDGRISRFERTKVDL